MDREGLAALQRASEAQFEHASAKLRRIGSQIAACEAQLAELCTEARNSNGAEALPLALAGCAEIRWRRWRAERIAELQRERAALAPVEIEARGRTARAFGRLQAIRTLVARSG